MGCRAAINVQQHGCDDTAVHAFMYSRLAQLRYAGARKIHGRRRCLAEQTMLPGASSRSCCMEASCQVFATVPAGSGLNILADVPVGCDMHQDVLTQVQDVVPLPGRLESRCSCLVAERTEIRKPCWSGVGHCPHDEAPEVVNSFLVEFIRQLRS